MQKLVRDKCEISTSFVRDKCVTNGVRCLYYDDKATKGTSQAIFPPNLVLSPKGHDCFALSCKQQVFPAKNSNKFDFYR